MTNPSELPTTPKPSPVKAWLKRVVTIRDTPTYIEGVLFGAGFIGLTFLIWWLLTAGASPIVERFVLQTPGETFRSIRDLWQRELSLSIVISLLRVIGGFALAAAIGVPLGIIAGSYLRLNSFIKPAVLFGRSIPIAALIPLSLVWFGLGEFNKVMFIFLATIAFVIFDTVNTVHSVPDRFVDTAYTLGARQSRKTGAKLASLAGLVYGLFIMVGWFILREDETQTLMMELSNPFAWYRFIGGFIGGFLLWYPIAGHQVMRKVMLPLAMPDIVNSLRLIFGLAFGYIMLAEVINAKTGIGALIITSQRRGYYAHIYLCLIIISFVAWGIDRLIMMMQRQLFPHIKHGEN